MMMNALLVRVGSEASPSDAVPRGMILPCVFDAGDKTPDEGDGDTSYDDGDSDWNSSNCGYIIINYRESAGAKASI